MELQSELSEKHIKEKQLWQKKEVELQNIVSSYPQQLTARIIFLGLIQLPLYKTLKNLQPLNGHLLEAKLHKSASSLFCREFGIAMLSFLS